VSTVTLFTSVSKISEVLLMKWSKVVMFANIASASTVWQYTIWDVGEADGIEEGIDDVGFFDGDTVGFEVGATEGTSVGETVGNLVGPTVGMSVVGEFEGLEVGEHVGTADGISVVGFPEGKSEGMLDGLEIVGEKLGIVEGKFVKNALNFDTATLTSCSMVSSSSISNPLFRTSSNAS